MTQNLNLQPETEQQVQVIERVEDNVEQNPKVFSPEAFLAEKKKIEEKIANRIELEKPRIAEIREKILKLIQQSDLFFYKQI
jgi:hypothetical protein